MALGSSPKERMDGRSGKDTPKGAHTENPIESFNTYLEYNKVLRTWFVAFGVGGPALFLVNERIAEHLVKFGMLREVAVLFLVGTAVQIVGALLNKVTNWYVYIAAYEVSFRDTWQHKFSEWFTQQFWFDIMVDAITVICFGFAAWRMLTAFAQTG
jgi:hypothetical protein